MTSGMFENAIKQMINKFSGISADDLIANMKKQPQASMFFNALKSKGFDEDKFKKMINDEIISRQK